jgi:uncharacterized protein YegP (UPF0339 family)
VKKNTWKEWTLSMWVLEAPNGEVIDEIQKSLDGIYLLKSNSNRYTSLIAAQKARLERNDDTR